MPRIRTIKPQHWNDRELPNISMQAHLLWLSMWNFADDTGVIENDLHLIKSQSFPRRQDIDPAALQGWINELLQYRFILSFSYDNVPFFLIRTFSEHQKIDKPQPSKIPADVIRGILAEHSPNTLQRVTAIEYSKGSVKSSVINGPEAMIGNDLKNGPGEAERKTGSERPAGNKKVFLRPTQDQLKQFFIQISGPALTPDVCHVQAYEMYNHYEANGWKQGRGKNIVSWEAAARNWLLRFRKGTFDSTSGPGTKSHLKNTAVPVVAGEKKATITPTQVSINYTYERYCEAPAETTIATIEAFYWDEITNAGLFDMPHEDKEKIKASAVKYLSDAGKELTEDKIKATSKKLAVLEFFRVHHAAGNHTVYS